MTKPDLGTKRVCPTTGRKFYDLNRDPVVSPYTGQAFPRSTFDPPTRGSSGPARARAAEVDDEEDVEKAAGPELVSLQDVEAAEGGEKAADDVDLGDDEAAEGPFIEEDEEAGADDVVGLIDNELEEDEET